jgi:hypothetical protein
MRKTFDLALNFVWQDLADTFAFVSPIIVCFLLFCWYKCRQQKQMIISVFKYGMWRGSDQR